MSEYKELSLAKKSLVNRVSYLQDKTTLNVMVRLEHYSCDDNYDLVILVLENGGILIHDEVTHTFETNEKEEAIKEGNSMLRKVKSWLSNMNVTINNELVLEEM